MVRTSQKERPKRNVLFDSVLYIDGKKSFAKNLLPVPANLHILLYWSAYSRAPIKSFLLEIFDIEEVSSSVNKVT